MATRHPSTEPLGDPIPLRLSARLLKRIKKAAAALNHSDSDTMRLALDIGLEQLERIRYNIPAAVVDKATQQ